MEGEPSFREDSKRLATPNAGHSIFQSEIPAASSSKATGEQRDELILKILPLKTYEELFRILRDIQTSCEGKEIDEIRRIITEKIQRQFRVNLSQFKRNGRFQISCRKSSYPNYLDTCVKYGCFLVQVRVIENLAHLQFVTEYNDQAITQKILESWMIQTLLIKNNLYDTFIGQPRGVRQQFLYTIWQTYLVKLNLGITRRNILVVRRHDSPLSLVEDFTKTKTAETTHALAQQITHLHSIKKVCDLILETQTKLDNSVSSISTRMKEPDQR